MKKILLGKCDKDIQNYRQWLVGDFLPLTSPLKTDKIEIKWGRHKKGEIKKNGITSEPRNTLCILIFGTFKITFPNDKIEHILKDEGDYIYFKQHTNHDWKALEDSLIITIRWF